MQHAWEGCEMFLDGKPERKRPLTRASVDGRIILQWMLRK
jgi:hypothetical protein